MNTTDFNKQFDQLQQADAGNGLDTVRQDAFKTFNLLGIPNAKHEEWKYTRIANLFNKEYIFGGMAAAGNFAVEKLNGIRLPGHEQANELVFVNGVFSFALSSIRSASLVVLPLEQAAAGEYAAVVHANLGHSARYLKDGINALNTAFLHGGVFVHVKKGKITEHPVYIYHIADAANENVFAQPRSLVHIAEIA